LTFEAVVRMNRRKGEITGTMNERDFPHIVEVALPPGGFGNQTAEFDSFHREKPSPIRCVNSLRFCGRSWCTRPFAEAVKEKPRTSGAGPT
jgi:hypothetical protein